MNHADLEKPAYRAWIDFLRSGESWSHAQMAAHQLSELRRVLQHAYQNTRAYRRLFDQVGLKPAALYSIEDLARFPMLEKEMLRDQLEDFSVDMAGRTYVTTGGSTGIPLGMYRDPEAFPKELASKAYQYYRVGWKEGDRQLVLRGLPIDTTDHSVFVPEFNELRCSSYHLTPQWMEVFYQKALDYQPEWLRCYPSAGTLFARWLQENAKPFPALKGILCASENCYDFQKELLSQVFGCRVFSHYGHYELAVLAGFCEKADTYHVLPQYGYAELIDAHGKPVTQPGEMGEIVATSFIMQATPFIRYRTRDVAVLAGWECPACGRPYPIWERIEGRLQEFILSGRKRLISMTAMNFHTDIFDHLQQFQFYQEEIGVVEFHFIPKPGCSAADLHKIEQGLRSKLGDDVHLTLRAVDALQLTQRGKSRFLVQKLNIPWMNEN